MQNPGYPSSSLALQNLEEAWRLRSERARERYEWAGARYRELLEEKPEGLIPRENDPLALAWRAESEALAEYTRILAEYMRILSTKLTVDGRISEEQLGAMADGGRE